MANSDNLRKAKEEKNDEFYTRLEDIEAEISQHKDYVKQFKGKTVLCNCDDPEWSNFFVFFRNHFKQLGLKKLITTHYNKDGKPSYKIEWCGEMLNDDPINMITTPLSGDGDFRSAECIEILKEADIVVTNPPFSLFREYVAQLIEYNKDFVILGRPDACNYQMFFPLLKSNKIRVGYKSFSKDMYFIVSEEHAKNLVATKKERSGWVKIDGKVYGRAQACWYTTLDLDKAHEEHILTKNYYGNEEKYPGIDNYNAIFVDSIANIPKDYMGVIGVPTNFIEKYCIEQFELLGITTGRYDFTPEGNPTKRYEKPIQHNLDGSTTNGSKVNTGMAIVLDTPPDKIYYTAENVKGYLIIKYPRLLIKRKQNKKEDEE